MPDLGQSGGSDPNSNTSYARGLVESVVRRDDTTLIEALLADAIDHLCDAIDDLTSRGQSDR